MVNLQIIPYEPVYRDNFIALNVEWLTQYFTVEPHDKNVFENIEEVILTNGGEIFFCVYNNEIAAR